MAASGKPDLLRKYNSDLIRDLIRINGPITKVELARLSGASVPTVNKIVNQMEADGEICKTDEDSNTVGRKAAAYIVNKDAGYFIVFFIQNGIISAALASNDGEIIQTESVKPDVNSLDDVNNSIFEKAALFISQIPSDKLNAIGLGIPGVIDADNHVNAIPTIPCWEGKDLQAMFEERYHVPVFIENDVKLMTIGVYKHEFSDYCRNMIFLYVSRGLGAGIVINSRLYKGSTNFAGEYGFMLPRFDHTLPHSGNTGNLELEFRDITEKRISGAELSENEYQSYIEMLSGVITNFTAVLNPELIGICAPEMNEEELKKIRSRVMDQIPERCMPELALIIDQEYGISGLIELCMSGITSRISLISETGLQL